MRKPWCGPPAWAGPGDRCTTPALTPSLLQLSCARRRSRCRRRRCHAARAPTAPARGQQPRWVLRGGGSAGQLLLWHLALIWGLRRGSGQLCLTRCSPHRQHGRSPRHGCNPRQPTLGARLLVLSRFCRHLMAHRWLARLPQLLSFGLIRSSPSVPPLTNVTPVRVLCPLSPRTGCGARLDPLSSSQRRFLGCRRCPGTAAGRQPGCAGRCAAALCLHAGAAGPAPAGTRVALGCGHHGSQPGLPGGTCQGHPAAGTRDPWQQVAWGEGPGQARSCIMSSLASWGGFQGHRMDGESCVPAGRLRPWGCPLSKHRLRLLPVATLLSRRCHGGVGLGQAGGAEEGGGHRASWLGPVCLQGCGCLLPGTGHWRVPRGWVLGPSGAGGWREGVSSDLSSTGRKEGRKRGQQELHGRFLQHGTALQAAQAPLAPPQSPHPAPHAAR